MTSNSISERLSDTLIEQAKRVDLLVFAEQRFGTMRRNAHHDWQGKCPRCGADYFHVYQAGVEWRFRCYECHEKPSDGIEMLRWLQPGLSFTDAVTQLVGNSWHGTTAPAQHSTQRRPATQPRPAEWARKAAAILQMAQERLLETDGEPGQEYLISRGLEPRTWLQFGLGYRPDANVPGTEGKQKAPAICLPWYAGGKLVGVRYRFLEAQDGTKLSAEYGSQFRERLFGGQALPDLVTFANDDGKRLESLCDLVIAEGEINAMSIWQVAGDTNLHVLSLGSESAKLSSAMVAFAKRYRNVIIWADRAEVARNLQTAIPSANSITSPNGRDANDLLRDGLLGAVLGMARLRACRNNHECEGLLWDLWDAAQTWLGVDAGTVQVIQKIANSLGKTLGPIKQGI
jgi:hypothetical protein